MTKAHPILKTILLLIGLLTSGYTHAQTPLYPPSPRIDFSNMSTTKTDSKSKFKEMKQEEKEKTKSIKEMKKQMAEKTGWPEDSINRYGEFLSRMKPEEVQKFESRFDEQLRKDLKDSTLNSSEREKAEKEKRKEKREKRKRKS